MGSEAPIQNKVWPELAGSGGQYGYVFLDWFHPSSKTIWAKGLTNLYKQMNFDGIWLDMNEVTGFCNGASTTNCTVQRPNTTYQPRQLKADNDTWFQHYSQNDSSTYYLPFIPSLKWNFDNMTLSLNATHPSNNAT
jgi:alpha-glucosidase (family GH31 glycosyl hydrolase)